MTPVAFLSDPPESGVLAAAARWIEGVLTGGLATAIAVIAVGCVGPAMLSGRIEIRRGLTVLLGCFLLFGASAIAEGLRGAAGDATYSDAAPTSPPPLVVPPLPQAGPERPGYFDPYAGASVPQQ